VIKPEVAESTHAHPDHVGGLKHEANCSVYATSFHTSSHHVLDRLRIRLAHLQGILLLALGLVWPRLNLSLTMSRIAFCLLLFFAILAAYLMGRAWAAGRTMPLAAGTALGSPFQGCGQVVAYSSAPTGPISFTLVLWGLRIATLDCRSEL
jgi:hypothetical protein